MVWDASVAKKEKKNFFKNSLFWEIGSYIHGSKWSFYYCIIRLFWPAFSGWGGRTHTRALTCIMRLLHSSLTARSWLALLRLRGEAVNRCVLVMAKWCRFCLGFVWKVSREWDSFVTCGKIFAFLCVMFPVWSLFLRGLFTWQVIVKKRVRARVSNEDGAIKSLKNTKLSQEQLE